MKTLALSAALGAVVAVGVAACAQDRFSEDERDGVDLSDVANLPGSTENDDAQCSDGLDNDGDTLIDCADANCYPENSPNAPTVCAVQTEADRPGMCSDGLDNDGNGDIDCADDACVFTAEACENTDAKCSDGLDNDNDGDVDCRDVVCRISFDVTVCPEEDTDELCDNGVDDDFNGFTDCEDFGCSMNPNVTVCN